MHTLKKIITGFIPLAILCICASVTTVKAEGETDTYTVTIPAEVTISETSKSGTIPITAELASNTNLVITITSKNNFNLRNTSNGHTHDLGYSISDTAPLVFSNEGTDTATKKYSIKASLKKTTALYSGEYTDILTFTMTSGTITDTNQYLNFHVNVENESDVSITTTKKVVKQGEVYGTLPTPVRTGYDFDGWYTSAEVQDSDTPVSSDTMMNDNKEVNLYAKWTVHTFKNTMTFWAWGLHGEGNNGPGTAIRLADDKILNVATAYGSKFMFTLALVDPKVEVPNGYQITQFGSATADAANTGWRRYELGYEFTQPDWSVNAEYEYDLIEYKITYDLAGGELKKNNPSTYTVLYPVTFTEEPEKEGYTFAGWYIGDEKVTGINVGCANDSFANVNKKDYTIASKAFYAALENRTIGDIKVTAHWTKNPDSSNADNSDASADSDSPETEEADPGSDTQAMDETESDVTELTVESESAIQEEQITD